MGLGITLLIIGVLGMGIAASIYKTLPVSRMARLRSIAHLAIVSTIVIALGIFLICYPPK